MGKRMYDQPFWSGLFGAANSIRIINESLATIPVRQIAEIATGAAALKTALAFSPVTETLSSLAKVATDSLDTVGYMSGLDLTAAAASTISQIASVRSSLWEPPIPHVWIKSLSVSPLEEAFSAVAQASSIAAIQAALDTISWSCLRSLAASVAFLIVPSPDALHEDVFVILSPDASQAEYAAAAVRNIARYICRKWQIHDQIVKATLIERAQAEGRSMASIKEEEIHVAVYLALGEKHEPQPYHLGQGKGWFKGSDGKKRLLAPEALPMEAFLRWLTRRAIEIAAERKTMRTQKREASLELLKPADLSTGDEGDPEYLWLQQERKQEVWGMITAPRERQLVEFLLDGYTISDAAQHMGIAPATARVLHFRLRLRLI